MSEEARIIKEALQWAVVEELKRKAEKGYKAVIAGLKGEPKILSARTVIRQMEKMGLLSPATH